MPSLDWIGKRAVVNHHREVPTRLLHCDGRLSYGDPDAGNLLVQGDNLEALKALLPYYAGAVKCIYIDPPYNTGNEGWVYNDNVNSPEIRAWLNTVVGKEGEDLSRHDKWLCMMYPRLRLLKDFLTDDGIIFASIDDNELTSLLRLFDEVFEPRNFVGVIVWRNVTDNNPTRISVEHEYIICYARKKASSAANWKASSLPIKDRLLELAETLKHEHPDLAKRQIAYTSWFKENKAFMWPFDRYKFIDDGGIFTGSQSVHNPGKEGYRYDVIHPTTGKPCQQPLMGYRFPKATMDDLLAGGRILFGEDETKIIELKLYVQDYKAKLPSVIEMDTRLGANELKRIFPDSKKVFQFSKPSQLIQEILSFVTGPSDLVMDTFGGSGTTAHAVLKLNQEDGGARKFILCEMDTAVSEEVTAPRIATVIKGYDGEAGVAGGFRFCTLGKPIFDEWGAVNEGVTFADLAAFVFFSDTGSPIPKKASAKTSLLGTFQDRAIYMLFSPETLGVADEAAGNVLTLSKLDSLPLPAPGWSGPRVVYAEGCTVPPDRLAAAGVTFKQVPYQLAAS